MSEEYYLVVGTVGIPFQCKTLADLTNATLTEINLIKPDGTTDKWTASVATSVLIDGVATVVAATSGWLTYNLTAADIDRSGYWIGYSYIETSDGAKVYGPATRFRVLDVGEVP
jgi:hypothetical protein